jgi:hypothetical protein
MAVVPTRTLSSDRAVREQQVLECLRGYVGNVCFFDYEGRETHDSMTGAVIARDGVVDAPANDAYAVLSLDEVAKVALVRNTATRAEVRVPFYKVREASQIVVP